MKIKYGSVTKGTQDGNIVTSEKVVFNRGREIQTFTRVEETQYVGESGDEAKDILAIVLSLISKYQAKEIQTFGVIPDHYDPKTGKITRVKIITENIAREI